MRHNTPFRTSSLTGSYHLIALFLVKCIATTTEPVSVNFGDEFYGDDGKWSAAQIRVGSPEQWLSAFPATVSSETWVVGPDGCDGTLTCQTLRGGLFFTNESTTWKELGDYELGFSTLSSTTDYGYYGFDTLSISDSVSAPNQIVAVINDTSHWIGQFGLSVQETRFQTQVDYLSFISSLVQNESAIPSHSYGYTAGAYYQGKAVSGSLTLGGVDTTRFTPNNATFTLASGYVPKIAITGIKVSSSPTTSSESFPPNWNESSTSLMQLNQAAIFTIDSSTSFLWLPQEICDATAKALNLTYDETLQLYTYGGTSTPSTLANWGLNFTFTIANSPTSSQTMDLTIPYAAFDQQLSYPFPGLFNTYNSTLVNYFPLRRANSTDQYTIGRVFLQETYLTVNYEQNNFSLSQALFPDTSAVQPNLVAIPRLADSKWPGPQNESSSGLSAGAKAGIGVGVALAVIAIIGLLWLFCIRRKRSEEKFEEKDSNKFRKLFGRSKRTKSPTPSDEPAELLADRRHPTEMIADSSNSRFELAGNAPIEMSAGDVSPAFFQEHSNNSYISRNDPRNPTELLQPGVAVARRTSTSKESSTEAIERSESPAPAYSSSDSNTQDQPRNNSTSISPYSVRPRNNPFHSGTDTNSSGEHGISPVTGSGSDRDVRSTGENSHSGSSNYSRMRPSPVSPVSPGSRTLLPLPNVIRSRPTTGQPSRESEPLTSTQSADTNRAENNTRLSTLPPNSSFQTMERSTSRNSRFREVMNEEETNDATVGQAPALQNETSAQNQDHPDPSRPSLARSRFSWEG